MKTNLAPYTKQERALFSRHITPFYVITGGRNAAVHLAWFNDRGMCMKDEHGNTVVSITPRDSGVHGQWMVFEFAYDTDDRQWSHVSEVPMIMDDFGTLFEVSK
jgi:hypothetical protein